MSAADRVKAHMESPYDSEGMQTVSEGGRVANALEYIAYQLGEIKVTLREMNEREISKSD